MKQYRVDGLKTIQSNEHYSSVHYVIKVDNFFAEIQVRILAEEIWSAVSHKLNYPIKSKFKLVIQELNTINRICGTIDEMCNFIYNLENEL